MDLDRLQKNLTRAGFAVHRFPTAGEAKAWLTRQWKGKTIGIGGSMTLEGMGLYEALSQENTVYWHWHAPGQATLDQAAQAQVYLTSANALAETGELINIDGTGNRVSAALGAHEVVCYVVGQNKVAPTLDQALWRARNIAAPLNARRLKRETPCAQGELKCHDCKSPQRICNALVVHYKKIGSMDMEVVLVDQELGF